MDAWLYEIGDRNMAAEGGQDGRDADDYALKASRALRRVSHFSSPLLGLFRAHICALHNCEIDTSCLKIPEPGLTHRRNERLKDDYSLAQRHGLWNPIMCC